MNQLTSYLFDLRNQLDTYVHQSPTYHGRRLSSETPAWVTFIVVLGICGLLYYVLMKLKGISEHWKKKMKGRIKAALNERKQIKDVFRSQNGYSWDLVFVFPIYAPEVKLTRKQNNHSFRRSAAWQQPYLYQPGR